MNLNRKFVLQPEKDAIDKLAPANVKKFINTDGGGLFKHISKLYFFRYIFKRIETIWQLDEIFVEIEAFFLIEEFFYGIVSIGRKDVVDGKKDVVDGIVEFTSMEKVSSDSHVVLNYYCESM